MVDICGGRRLQKMNIFNVMKMISAVKLFSSLGYFSEREMRIALVFDLFQKHTSVIIICCYFSIP